MDVVFVKPRRSFHRRDREGPFASNRCVPTNVSSVGLVTPMLPLPLCADGLCTGSGPAWSSPSRAAGLAFGIADEDERQIRMPAGVGRAAYLQPPHAPDAPCE